MATAIYQYPVIAAAVIGALGYIAHRIGKATHLGYRAIKEAFEGVAYIREEMNFNGGSTLRDAVGRVETQMMSLDETLTEYIEESSADRADLRRRIDSIAKRGEAA